MSAVSKRAKTTSRHTMSQVSKSIVELYRKYGAKIDIGSMESKLFLAGRPFGVTAEEFIGINTAFSCFIAATMSGMIIGNLIPGFAGFIIFVIATLLPWNIVKNSAKTGRETVRKETMDLCSRLQAGTSAGVSALRILEWSSEGKGLLSEILAKMMAEITTGKPLHLVFGKIGMTFDIPEADELALIVKHHDQQGVEISSHLQELSRDFRYRKEMEVSRKASKLKPKVVAVTVLVALIAVGSLIVAPVIMDSFRDGILKYM